MLSFGCEVLWAILRASTRGGIKSVTIRCPVSWVRCYGPLIAAFDGEAGQGIAWMRRDLCRLLGNSHFSIKLSPAFIVGMIVMTASVVKLATLR